MQAVLRCKLLFAVTVWGSHREVGMYLVSLLHNACQVLSFQSHGPCNGLLAEHCMLSSDVLPRVLPVITGFDRPESAFVALQTCLVDMHSL